jgi:hypothetical protein
VEQQDCRAVGRPCIHVTDVQDAGVDLPDRSNDAAANKVRVL